MLNFLSDKFSSIFSKLTGKGALSVSDVDQALERVQEALLEADVPYGLVTEFCAKVKHEVVGQKVLKSLKPGEQLVKVVHDKIKDFLGGKDAQPFSFAYPAVAMVLGLQGSGKTTTLGKLANFAKRKGAKLVLLGSVDFYRPAAVDQLEVLAGQVGVTFYRAQSTDPVAAAQEIYTQFKEGKHDLLLLDTAGRLHVDDQMLQELRDIDQRLNPKYKLLVLDSMTGQESLNVARAFNDSVGFDGAILSKMDSDTRGGAAFSFRYALKKPILFLGVGEKIEDIELCHPERMAGRILGMGDMNTLLERANEKIKQADQEKASKALLQGKMTLQDFADQLAMMNKLGSLSSVANYLPGMGGKKISPEMLEKGEKEMKRFKAIISSMTPKERVNARLLDKSRKRRVARGAGVVVSDVNMLLSRFEQMQQYAKLLKRFGGFKRFLGS